jgi:hypothetical protein
MILDLRHPGKVSSFSFFCPFGEVENILRRVGSFLPSQRWAMELISHFSNHLHEHQNGENFRPFLLILNKLGHWQPYQKKYTQQINKEIYPKFSRHADHQLSNFRPIFALIKNAIN